MTEDTKNKGGRPPYEPTDKDRRMVEAMAAAGLDTDGVSGGFTREQIAAVLGISKDTLLKYFRRELETAHLEAVTKMRQSLFQQGIGTPGRKRTKTTPAVPAVPPNVIATKAWLEYHAAAVRTERAMVAGDKDQPIQVKINLVG